MMSAAENAAGGQSGKRLKSEMRVFYGPAQKDMMIGFGLDISAGGLYLKTDLPLAPEDNLTLHFTLPDLGQSISCQAKVAWVNEKENPRKPELPAGVGVQFVDLTLESLQGIRRFLEHNEIEPTW